MAKKPEELQQVLHYTFKNPALLRIALTHTSFANESKVATTHNERLEFLGDSVLSVVVADYLFHQSGRPEGELTRMRASLVSEDALFQFAQEIHLGEYLRLGHGEDLGGGRNRPSVVSDAFEAVIAALYLDGGMEAARNFILPFITEGKTAEEDYKTQLQEVVQQDPSAVLRYEVTGESGPDHAKKFTVCVWRNGEKLAEAPGRSKKAAEQHAAKIARDDADDIRHACAAEHLQHRDAGRALRLAVVGVALGAVAQQVAPAVVPRVVVLLFAGGDDRARLVLGADRLHEAQKARALVHVLRRAGFCRDAVAVHITPPRPEGRTARAAATAPDG